MDKQYAVTVCGLGRYGRMISLKNVATHTISRNQNKLSNVEKEDITSHMKNYKELEPKHGCDPSR